MDRPPNPSAQAEHAQVVDFDEALLDARPAEALAELMAEATLLAEAFAPDGRAAQIEASARSLQSGVRDLEKGRAHGRLLAAALRRLAREAKR